MALLCHYLITADPCQSMRRILNLCGRRSATDLRGRLLVALPHGDILVKAGDLLRERRGIRLSLDGAGPVFFVILCTA